MPWPGRRRPCSTEGRAGRALGPPGEAFVQRLPLASPAAQTQNSARGAPGRPGAPFEGSAFCTYFPQPQRVRSTTCTPLLPVAGTAVLYNSLGSD